MLVILNGLPGCGKTYLCKKLKDRYHIIHENRQLVEELLLSPNYLKQQQGFIDLWFEAIKELIDLWGKDSTSTIIFVCSLQFRQRIFWDEIRNNKPYEEWKLLNQELEILIMIETYIFAKFPKVLTINLNIEHHKIMQQLTKHCSPGDAYINETILWQWEAKLHIINDLFYGAIVWYNDNKFDITILENRYFTKSKYIFVPSYYFYSPKTACLQSLLTSNTVKGFNCLEYIRTLHSLPINVDAVMRAIAQTPWLIEKK